MTRDQEKLLVAYLDACATVRQAPDDEQRATRTTAAANRAYDSCIAAGIKVQTISRAWNRRFGSQEE